MTVQLPSFSKRNLPNLDRLATTVGLVLASGSPRRKQLLESAGIPFEVVIPEVEEQIPEEISPGRLVTELAHQKVSAIKGDAKRAYLGCDTIVVLNGEILTKPDDEKDAMRILRKLSGNHHSVFTGLCLYDSRLGLYYETSEESRVKFNLFSDEELADYIATGEPLDKAGAYGIQGMGGFLVDSVEGNVDNVVGLPMGALEHLAAQYWENYA